MTSTVAPAMWRGSVRHMSKLTDVRDLLNAPTYVMVATVTAEGQPQSSVVWTKTVDDTIVFSTLRGRQKARNLDRDPRITLLAYDPANPYRYVEIRGTATLAPDPEGDLLNELSQAYTGEPWTEPVGADRVVVTVTPTKVLVR